MPASLQSVPTVSKRIVLPSAAVTEPEPVMNSQNPPAPLVPPIPGTEEKVKEYVAFPTCWGIAGPPEDPPAVKLTNPLPVPWTSQFSPAAGAAIALAATPRLSASTSSRARIGFAQRDVISVLLFR